MCVLLQISVSEGSKCIFHICYIIMRKTAVLLELEVEIGFHFGRFSHQKSKEGNKPLLSLNFLAYIDEIKSFMIMLIL